MEEIQLAARAYYSNSTEEMQSYARNFFNSMDANGDGVVSSAEFVAFLSRNGYTWVGGPHTFSQLDANGDGRLDFWEAMAFYYLVKTRNVVCDSCASLLPGLYFTCVACFDSAGATNSFDLCAKCYGGRRFTHRHAVFVDSYVLLRSKIGISPQMNVNRAVTQAQPNNDDGLTDDTDWFKILEVAIDTADLLTGGCSIM